jgi:hypothetical protein
MKLARISPDGFLFELQAAKIHKACCKSIKGDFNAYFRVSIVVVAWLLTVGTSSQSYADVITYTFTPDSSISFAFLPFAEIDGSFTIEHIG